MRRWRTTDGDIIIEGDYSITEEQVLDEDSLTLSIEDICDFGLNELNLEDGLDNTKVLSNEGDIPINEQYFPDEIFRMQLSKCSVADKNADGYLSKEERENVVVLNSYDWIWPSKEIDFTGIEWFPNLKSLTVYKGVKLDVSKNIHLRYLRVIEGDISYLNLSNNTELEYLVCSKTEMRSIDISKCVNLKEINCDSIHNLDVSNCNNLEVLRCRGCYHWNMDKDSSRMTEAYLTKLDLKNNKNLVYLDCSHNNLTDLDVSNLSRLEYLDCSCCNLEVLDVSSCSSLIIMECSENHLQEIIFGNHPQLAAMWSGYQYGKLEKIDITGCNLLQKDNIERGERSTWFVHVYDENGAYVDDIENHRITFNTYQITPNYIDKYRTLLSSIQDSHYWIDEQTAIIKNGEVIYGPPPTNVTINEVDESGELIMKLGETVRLTASVTPKYAIQSFYWDSTNMNVATVNDNGEVTALRCGTTSVSVHAGGKMDEIKVTVISESPIAKPTITPAPTEAPTPKPTAKPSTEPVKVKLNKSKAMLYAGKTLTLKATVKPSKAKTTLTWTSSNSKVAKVSKKGVVKALKKGTAIITVTTANGKKATCKITVPAAPTKVTLNKKKATLKVGKKLTLKATLTPTKAKTALTWTSSNKKVATVSKKGVVKAIKPGKAKITVKTANGKKATITITVKK